MFVLRRLPACLALLMLGALSLRLGLAFLVTVPLMLVLVLLFIPRALLQTILATVSVRRPCSPPGPRGC